MAKLPTIEIGSGFVVSAMGGFGVLQNNVVNWLLVGIGGLLILHGFYEIYLKQHLFLKLLLKKWLISRGWGIYILEGNKYKDNHFAFVIENKQQHRVSVRRSKKNGDVLIFHMTLPKDLVNDINSSGLTNTEQDNLINELRLFLAGKNTSYESIKWPLDDKNLIEQILPIDTNLSKEAVDAFAKQIVFTNIGMVTITKKYLSESTPYTQDSQNQ